MQPLIQWYPVGQRCEPCLMHYLNYHVVCMLGCVTLFSLLPALLAPFRLRAGLLTRRPARRFLVLLFVLFLSGFLAGRSFDNGKILICHCRNTGCIRMYFLRYVIKKYLTSYAHVITMSGFCKCETMRKPVRCLTMLPSPDTVYVLKR